MKLTVKACKTKIKNLENELKESNEVIRELGRENEKLRRKTAEKHPEPLSKFLDDKIGYPVEAYNG